MTDCKPDQDFRFLLLHDNLPTHWEGNLHYLQKLLLNITLKTPEEFLSLLDSLEDFHEYCFDSKRYAIIKNALRFDANLSKMRDILVPDRVSEEIFWKLYFYHVHQIKDNSKMRLKKQISSMNSMIKFWTSRAADSQSDQDKAISHELKKVKRVYSGISIVNEVMREMNPNFDATYSLNSSRSMCPPRSGSDGSLRSYRNSFNDLSGLTSPRKCNFSGSDNTKGSNSNKVQKDNTTFKINQNKRSKSVGSSKRAKRKYSLQNTLSITKYDNLEKLNSSLNSQNENNESFYNTLSSRMLSSRQEMNASPNSLKKNGDSSLKQHPVLELKRKSLPTLQPWKQSPLKTSYSEDNFLFEKPDHSPVSKSNFRRYSDPLTKTLNNKATKQYSIWRSVNDINMLTEKSKKPGFFTSSINRVSFHY